jgi:hypothetical protein
LPARLSLKSTIEKSYSRAIAHAALKRLAAKADI